MADGQSPSHVAGAPPRRGLGLGWRLALLTSLVVAVVMGTLTALQTVSQLRARHRALQMALQRSLRPLARQLQRARSAAVLARAVKDYRRAHRYEPRHVIVRDARGRIFRATSSLEPLDGLHASIAASIPLLGGRGAIHVVQPAHGYHQAVERHWQAWWVHMVVTLGVIFVSLLLTIGWLVRAPIERLIDGVRKMEMGYWGEALDPGGAWELRWLGWRFRCMGTELKETVSRLVAAERKALSARSAELAQIPRELHANPTREPAQPEPRQRQALLERCRTLERASPSDAHAIALAREAWRHDVALAEQLGDYQLKARVDDAALRLLDAREFARLEADIAHIVDPLDGWARRRMDALDMLLKRHGVPYVSLGHRIKHTASVWRKMRAKGLALDQVHDLFALRVVVPTESDCYAVLGLVHQTFAPIVGRFKDYIAAPKANGYQALHTCVRDDDGVVFEIQLRSLAMHQRAERGEADHASYKRATAAPPPDTRWRRLRGWFRREPIASLPTRRPVRR